MQITSTGKEFDESRVYIGWRGENRAEQIEFVMPRFYAGTDLLETDYTDKDAEQLRTRIGAFVEMLNQ